MKKIAVAIGGFLTIIVALIYFGYPLLDAQYQRAMDPIRRADAHQIADLIREFADKTGHLPFQQQANTQPFMVLIGHSPQHEDHFSNDPVLMRDAQMANSTMLESMLSKELGRQIKLPHDPQTVPTYAPNVYVYFASGNQMTVVSHLYAPYDHTVEYEWHGRPFYAYTITYDFETQ